jgi:hypothetical protein
MNFPLLKKSQSDHGVNSGDGVRPPCGCAALRDRLEGALLSKDYRGRNMGSANFSASHDARGSLGLLKRTLSFAAGLACTVVGLRLLAARCPFARRQYSTGDKSAGTTSLAGLFLVRDC